MVYLIAFCLIVMLILVGIFRNYKEYEKNYIFKLEELSSHYDAVIVLGAGIREDGTPCDILKDRLLAAVKVYNKGLSNKVVLTGEHRDKNYSEVISMKNWIIKYGIPEEDIILDGCGFCTYDSMYRARKKLFIKSAVICTNRYHLPRALYLAKKLGITAYGVASDIRPYDRMDKYKKRERLAQIKDFILINFFNRFR